MREILKFEDFVFESELAGHELIVEAFNSSVLQKITSAKEGGIGKAFYDTLSKMGIAASEITNLDISTLTPAEAEKHAKTNLNDILVYYSETEKKNPFSDDYQYRTIKADAVLALVKGKLFMGLKYDRWASKGGKAEYTFVPAGDAGTALGLSDKSGGKYGSGITSLKRIAEVSDVVYVINADMVAAHRTQELKAGRKESKQGAIAFKDDKQFKQENMSRYEAILKERAANTDIDKTVADAIDLLTTQIKDAIGKGAKTSYGEIMIGSDPKGREIRMSDAGNMMSNILSDYGRYAQSSNDAVKSREQWKERDNYYEEQVKSFAKSITDRYKKIQDLNYAW
jgi:hypothetical protein